jgi:DNA-binding transcriptional ArsR family regulator
MVQYPIELDRAFAALSDPTRRGILERLGEGSATITELAAPARMSLTGLKKHVRVLEDAGLVSTEKVGRSRLCTLEPAGLRDVQRWVDSHQRMWEERFDRLGEFLDRTSHETKEDDTKGGST